MGTEFVGSTPWKRISATLTTAGPRAAAIAYLGIDGPRLLRGLRRGDLLVVNASKKQSPRTPRVTYRRHPRVPRRERRPSVWPCPSDRAGALIIGAQGLS
ncbi:hypothetical protein NWFMUON74_44430 [Nocardia wallacei]|uniref:Uncharacterized protein n=1 Tax=Nocardia wallacei TaxID=480035 RepID=A0A7G1KPB1_9NOCA|nr:hypothetical protein [Nocardia wallacei]BCK56671.1 hypothetical protein NWFMUON74_44430 [Nocardia wallacei]